MNKRIKAKWIKALQSKKYKQTKCLLHDKGGFCCLGVLTDIYIKEKKLKWSGNPDYSYNLKGEEYILPKVVVRWAGLKSSNPEIKGEALSQYNDTRKCEFKEIAKMIKEGL